MSEFCKLLLAVIIITTFNCWSMEKGGPDKAINTVQEFEDFQMEEELQELYKKIEESNKLLEKLEAAKILKEQRRKRRDVRRQRRLNAILSNNIDSIQQPKGNQNEAFSKYLNFERVCLGFIGIIFGLKLWFNYYMQDENKKNGS